MAVSASETACVLLAAGQSSRYGRGDKLTAMFRGRPLGEHSAAMLGSLDFAVKIIVGRRTGFGAPESGFTHVGVGDAPVPQSMSLRLGVEAAMQSSPFAILIALADMPLVSARHIANLLASCPRTGERPVASALGGQLLPPALFCEPHYPSLCSLTGDQGARRLLGNAIPVEAAPNELIDLDTAEDFERYAAVLK